jgi:hypothetical protein
MTSWYTRGSGTVDMLLAEFWLKKQKKEKLGLLFSFWWSVWKERNRRSFQHQEKSPQQLARLLLDEIRFMHSAPALRRRVRPADLRGVQAFPDNLWRKFPLQSSVFLRRPGCSCFSSFPEALGPASCYRVAVLVLLLLGVGGLLFSLC